VTGDNQNLVPIRVFDIICVTQKIKHLWCRLVLTDTKNSNFGVDCLCQPIPKINFKKLSRPDPLGPRSKPTIKGPCHHCLGGAYAHAITPLEEPAPLEESRRHRTVSWSSPTQEKEMEKRKPTQEKEKKKRRGTELTGLWPRCVRRLKPTLAGEEKEGRYCCCAPPISLDAAPWTAWPRQEVSAHRELTLLDG
jgi:hypothetical protein